MKQFTKEDRIQLYGLLRVLWNMKSDEVARELHLSKSAVSRHMTCEVMNIEICEYFIQKIFGVKAKVIHIDEW